MPEQASPFSAAVRPNLHPPREPFDTAMMDMTHGHQLYVEQSGKLTGKPVVVLHGGPGGGCSPSMRRYFDPSVYRAVLFDQRGCGRSTPFADTDHNTTWDLVADIERIRERLNIDKWIVFGGSWGATLALVYAQTHPDRVEHLVLRGVFTMTKSELDWFYQGGAGQFWPEAWHEFSTLVPSAERGDMIEAYRRRIFGADNKQAEVFSQAWTRWENTLAVLNSSGRGGAPSPRYAKAFARIENHYFSNAGFLETDGQILRDMPKIAHIPGDIVQGRYDMICPPHTAHRLHKAWPASKLRMVTPAGHAMSEPGIAAELLTIMNDLAKGA